MAYANRQYYFLRFLIILLTAVVVVSCTTVEEKRKHPKKESIIFESKSSLLNWYDVTHKSYYGLKGAVKTLTIKPALMLGETPRPVNDEWELQFSREGKLTSKKKVIDGVSFKTNYSYSEQGLLSFVASYEDETLWRSSNFRYENGQLVKINYSDKKTNEQLTTKLSRQPTSRGWFEIESTITVPGLPTYSEYSKESALIWNSRGDINNGLGDLYYLRTVDSVTSSSVVNKGTKQMAGRGGYRYIYANSGLLSDVESFNAHANRLFHKTSYKYNGLGLLSSEERKVSDSSPFNEAIDEGVTYDYLEIDGHGNWTKRILNYKSRHQSQQFSESRSIVYY